MDTTNANRVREANKYYFIETSIAVSLSFVINLFVVSVFGSGLYNKTNQEIVSNGMAMSLKLAKLIIIFLIRFTGS